MKIVVTGTGYVALSTAVSLAKLGHNIICVDDNSSTINTLSKAIVTINEQGLLEDLAHFVDNQCLKFTTNFELALQNADVVICGVVTPISNTKGFADNTPILEHAVRIGESITSSMLYISVSTIPLGTTRRVKSIVDDKLLKRNINIKFEVASLPEFLREGRAIESFFNPSKIVIGADREESYKTILSLLAPVIKENTPIFKTSVEEAELIKLASNMLVATRIGYMNTLANVCMEMGSEYGQVHHAIFGENMPIYAGAGYGGECFPKDIRTLINGVEELGANATLLSAVEEFNQAQKQLLYRNLSSHYSGNLNSKRVAIWGLAAKEGGEDVENTSAISITESLLLDGATVVVYDKYAASKFKEKFPHESVIACDDKMATLLNSDALVILTDSIEFKSFDLKEAKELMKEPLILDAKNLFNNKDIEEAGIIYLRLFK
ncbi:MAG: UDP-glucose/GDP-mannose dehydrogenase family protein [Muribaculaceae bacterium]|nr:UDP-glucose/GDP-mannose dehydrogenase family protein [Muribaculaceae bacterium]